MKQYTEQLGTAPLGKLLLKLSLPGVAASVTQSLYNIIDTIFVGTLGFRAISALTIVFPYQILFWAVGGGTGTGIAALVSRRFGEKKVEEANLVAGQTFFLSLFWGLFFILVAIFFHDPILRLIGAKDDFFQYAVDYFTIISYAAPLAIFTSLAASLMRASGDTVKPMVIMITATAINIILCPLLIQGIGPFPRMEVAGSAWATFTAQAVGAVLALFFILANKTAYKLKISHLMPNWQIIKAIYQVGAPSAVLQITESFAFALWNIAVSSYGSAAVAAVGVVIRVSDFAFMPVMGVSQSLLPVVGYCFGADNFKRLWSAVKKATVGLMVLLTVITIGMEIWTPQIIRIFTKDEELLRVAVPAMRIMLSTMIVIGPSMITITALQGLGKGKTALALSLVRQFIVFVPLLFLFRAIWGLNGVWLCSPAADIIGVTISLWFLWREYKMHRHAGSKPEPLVQNF
jgi:putative MATE family efflux protein